MGTDVVKFAKPTTEDQCLAKTKTGITAAGFTEVVSVPHGLVGRKTDYLVYVDCLQSWGFNGAHVAVAALAANHDESRLIRTVVVKTLAQ